MKTINYKILFLLGLVVLFLPIQECYADNFHANIMNEIGDNFLSSAKSWASVLEGYAKNLFYLLLVISLSWTAIELALKHAEFGEIMAELTKFILFAGIFLWLITNGTDFAFKIFSTFSRLGSSLAGIPIGPNDITPTGPSEIIDLGIEFYVNIFNKAKFSMTNMGTNLISFMSLIIGLIFFLFTLIISVKLLVQIIILWCYMYAGIFFLGFGGSKWTREYVINYFKGVLIQSTQYFAMIIIVAMMKSLLSNFSTYINQASDPIQLLQLLVCPIIFWFLMEKLPPALAGIVTGSLNFSTGPTASSIASTGAGFVAGTAAGTAMAASLGKDFVSGVVDGIKGSNSSNDASNSITESNNTDPSSVPPPSKMQNENNNTDPSSVPPPSKMKKLGQLTGKSAIKAAALSIKSGAATAGFMSQSIKDPKGAIKSTMKGTINGASTAIDSVKDSVSSTYNNAKDSVTNTINSARNSIMDSYEKGKNAATPNNQEKSKNNQEKSKNKE